MANINSPFSQGVPPTVSMEGDHAALQSPVFGPDHDGDFPVSFGDTFMAQPAPITTPYSQPADTISPATTQRPSVGWGGPAMNSPFTDAVKK